MKMSRNYDLVSTFHVNHDYEEVPTHICVTLEEEAEPPPAGMSRSGIGGGGSGGAYARGLGLDSEVASPTVGPKYGSKFSLSPLRRPKIHYSTITSINYNLQNAFLFLFL